MDITAFFRRPRLLVHSALRWARSLRGLLPNTKHALKCIIERVSPDTWATSSRWPVTLERLAEDMGTCVRTAWAAVHALARAGYLTIIRGALRRFPDGTVKNEPSTYQLILPEDLTDSMRRYWLTRPKPRDIEDEFRDAAEEEPEEPTAPPHEAPAEPPVPQPLTFAAPTLESATDAIVRARDGAGDWDPWYVESVMRHGFVELRAPHVDPNLAERCAVAWALLTAHTLDVVRAAYSFGLYKHDEIGICVRDWCIKVVREGRDVPPKLRPFGRSLLRFFQAKATHRGAEAGVKRQEELAQRFGDARGPDENRRARATLATLPMLPVSHGF